MKKHIHDITRTLGTDNLTYPGDQEFKSLNRAGGNITVRTLTLSSHSGTHLDAPRHFFPEGETLEAMDISRFVMTAAVVDAGNAGVISADLIREQLPRIENGSAILFKTSNRSKSRDRFDENFVALDTSAAELLVEVGVNLAGIDYLSIEAEGDPAYPVHHMLLGHKILILEDVNLENIVPGNYELTVLPLKWHPADGAPARAILREIAD